MSEEPTIGEGLTKEKFHYDTLMDDLKNKGYLTPLADSSFSFNGTRATASQDIAAQLADASGPQPFMTRPIGEHITKNGYGIYLMGIANGMHVMALVYDGTTYSQYDQGTPMQRSFTSGVDFTNYVIKMTAAAPGWWRGSQPPPRLSAMFHINKLNLSK